MDDAKGFCMVEKKRTMTGMMARAAGTKAACSKDVASERDGPQSKERRRKWHSGKEQQRV